MDFNYLNTDTVSLEKFLDKVQSNLCQGVNVNIEDYFQKAVSAGEFSAVYPQLNKEVVIISAILFPLIKAGYIQGGLQGAMEVLNGFNTDQKLKIINVILEAQSGFAVGEAKVVQYFNH